MENSGNNGKSIFPAHIKQFDTQEELEHWWHNVATDAEKAERLACVANFAKSSEGQEILQTALQAGSNPGILQSH